MAKKSTPAIAKFNELQNEANNLLLKVQHNLSLYPLRAVNKKIHYGHVGDIAMVVDKLEECRKILAGEDLD